MSIDTSLGPCVHRTAVRLRVAGIGSLLHYCFRCSFYFSEGFLHLQNVVGQSIVEWVTGEQQDITVAVRVSAL